MGTIRYEIEYGDTAIKDLEHVPTKQRAQILRKIERLRLGLHGNIKRLRESDIAYRLRMGDYRILFDVGRKRYCDSQNWTPKEYL